MDGPNMLGLTGAVIAGYAYIPQIVHLIKEKCTAGISQRAFLLWLLSSILITINAIYIKSIVFIVLGGIQLVSTAVILIFCTIYKNSVCGYHEHHA
jgi:uncharacterized protein with PQ loop repeat